MGELFDEAHRVGHENTWTCFGLKRPNCRIKRSEELVLHQNFATGERAHQGGLASIGVTHQRDAELIPPCGTPVIAIALYGFQLGF